jgi:hypothetical protein
LFEPIGNRTVIANPQPAWLPLLLLALPGIGLARHWREVRSAVSLEHAGWARKLGIAALATLPIVLPTILANFSDEANFNGHHAVIAHLQNGTYPPRYLYEPSLPLRYHYGFDLAGAIVTGLLRVRLDHAIDVLTIALWPCMFLLLWRVGEHVGGRRAGLPVALAVCFSGGWPLIALMGPSCGLCTINGLRINPPFVHYFFQHPWSLGVPILCLVVLQRAALPRIGNQLLGLAALVCSLSLLSLSHAVLFIATVVALGMTEAWTAVRSRDRTAVTVLLGLGTSLVCAKFLGGFFVSGEFPPAGGIFDTGFSLREFSDSDAVLGQVQWNVASFGALLVLGGVGLLRVAREKGFLAILAALTLIIVNLLRYRHSWDIVKFATVGFLALAIGAGVALSDLAGWAHTLGRRLIYGVLVVTLAGQGLLYPFVLLAASYNPEGRLAFSMQMIRPYFSHSYPVNRDDAQAVSFLRSHMGPSEIVYRAEEKSEPYAIWGGVPTQASVYAENGNDDVYALGPKKLAARKELRRISEDWFDRLLAEHVTWVVADADDIAINTLLDCREGQRRAALAAQYGKVRVFRIQ